MKEISLNILDIAENSLKAGALLTEIIITETPQLLKFTVKDDGRGMSKDILSSVTNPFYTTRTTRKVGLGIPFLKLAAEQTGGSFEICSKTADEGDGKHGTTVVALFNKEHIDFVPLGDVISTLITLIQGHPERDFYFSHTNEGVEVILDTREIRAVLGDISLAEFEILNWIRDNLTEQYNKKIK